MDKSILRDLLSERGEGNIDKKLQKQKDFLKNSRLISVDNNQQNYKTLKIGEDFLKIIHF